jgi:tryptophan halogenase
LLEQQDGPALTEPRLLRFTTGHRERFWDHNVVGLGLSSGFLAPLESTSILLIQRGLHKMIELLRPGARPAAAVVAGYNRGMTRVFERIRDFIILHYCLTERRDSALWRDMASMELPETLAFKLHAWRQTGWLNMNGEEGFETTSWLAIHAGMGNWQETFHWKLFTAHGNDATTKLSAKVDAARLLMEFVLSDIWALWRRLPRLFFA